MRAGKLRHRFEIQEPAATQDVYGDPVPAWATVATRWGSLEEGEGRETIQADAVTADVSVTVTLRYFAGLTPKHRLKKGARVFQIESAANPDGVKREQVIRCKEVV